MKKILITGGLGRIGKTLRMGLKHPDWLLRLTDRIPIDHIDHNEEFMQFDLTNFEKTKEAMKDIDTVIHLAGIPLENTFDNLLPANFIATYNIFEAARLSGVKRIIFASTNHVIGFYHNTQSIDENVPHRPDSLYGVSKSFGESLGRFYADKYGMSVACIRIGSFEKQPLEKRHLRTWLSERDCVELFKKCIEAPSFHFVIVYGVSNNTRKKWQDHSSNQLNFHPMDNAELYVEQIPVSQSSDKIAEEFHGGSFCSDGFTGDFSKIK